jgi:hypothetical protein
MRSAVEAVLLEYYPALRDPGVVADAILTALPEHCDFDCDACRDDDDEVYLGSVNKGCGALLAGSFGGHTCICIRVGCTGVAHVCRCDKEWRTAPSTAGCGKATWGSDHTCICVWPGCDGRNHCCMCGNGWITEQDHEKGNTQ